MKNYLLLSGAMLLAGLGFSQQHFNELPFKSKKQAAAKALNLQALPCLLDSDHIFNEATQSSSAMGYKDLYTYDAVANLTLSLRQTQYTVGGPWSNALKYSFTYDANNNLSSQVLEEWYNNTYQNQEKETWTYNASNDVLTYLIQDWANNSWLNNYRNSTTYASAGKIILGEVWNYPNSVWMNQTKETYTLDANNNVTAYLVQSWRAASSSWLNAGLETHTYSPAGKELVDVMQNWDTINNAWIGYQKRLNTYTPAGFLSTEISQAWNGSAWQNSYKTEYTVNATGDVLQSAGSLWDNVNSVWHVLSTINNVYNANNTVAMEIFDNLNTSAPGQIQFGRYVYTYDAHDNQVAAYFQQSTDSVSWTNSSHVLRYYNCENVGLASQTLPGKDLAVYPNPASTFIQIRTQQSFEKLIVTDVSGRVVKAEAATDRVSLSGLTDGIYILRMVDKAGITLKTTKFIKAE